MVNLQDPGYMFLAHRNLTGFRVYILIQAGEADPHVLISPHYSAANANKTQ